MSKVDIIVPCYNYGRFLSDCVTSVTNQDVRELRVLIIDDASTDETPDVADELARKDSRVAYWRHSTNRGHIATFNEGLEWASADYTLLLSADDWIFPGALSRAAQLLDAHPEVGFAYGPHVQVSASEPPPPELHAPAAPGWSILTGEEFIRTNWSYNPVGTCTVLVRTALQKKLGGYRSELKHTGDMEMWMRFAAYGAVGRLNAYQGAYRRHAENMSDAYYGGHMLRNMRQRKAAIDMFFDNDGKRMNRAKELRQYLYEGLAEDTVKCAGQLFSHSHLKEFDEMLEFAATVDPTVRRRSVWRRQLTKRMIGPRLWALIRPARQWITCFPDGLHHEH